MDFSLTTLFVVPVSDSLPTTGSIENLTDGQTGIYMNKLYTVATSGTVGTASYIQVAQGRPGYGLGPKISDRIVAANVKRWEKILGHSQAVNEIWEVGSVAIPIGTDIVFSVRLHSNLINARFSNGLMLSVAVNSGCLTCSGDPCSTVANETVIDKILASINQRIAQQSSSANAVKLDSYLSFEKIGTGDTAVIRITGKPVETIPFNPADLSSRNVDKDRLWFRPFVYKAPVTTVDFISPSSCDIIGTTTLKQKSSFVTGTSEEVKMMEVDFYSYQNTQKSLFRNTGFNKQFISRVTDGTTYDLYYIQFNEKDSDTAVFSPRYALDETVIMAIPTGAGASIEAILVAYLGAVVDESGTAATSTTTTSTSSTSTTSTTAQYP